MARRAVIVLLFGTRFIPSCGRRGGADYPDCQLLHTIMAVSGFLLWSGYGQRGPYGRLPHDFLWDSLL